MSLKNIIDGSNFNFSLDNDLTINNDVVVDGDLNVSGFIYDGGVVVGVQGTNNVWTGTDTFKGITYTPAGAPAAPEDIINQTYMQTFNNLGSPTLITDNTWTGTNVFPTDIPTIAVASTLSTTEMVSKAQVDAAAGAIATSLLADDNTWTGVNDFTQASGTGFTVRPPVDDSDISTKDYIDTALTTFNSAGGNIAYVELLSPLTQTLVTTATQATLTGMQVNVVAGGGYVETGGGLPTDTNIWYAGSGGFGSFLIPPLDVDIIGNSNGSEDINITWTSNGYTYSLGEEAGTQSNPSAGTLGIGGYRATDYPQAGVFLGGQQVDGTAGKFADPTPAAIPPMINTFGVMNGWGYGGSCNAFSDANKIGTDSFISALLFKN